MSEIKNGGLYQYGPERFGRLILPQSEKCGTERVKCMFVFFALFLFLFATFHGEMNISTRSFRRTYRVFLTR